MPKLKYMLMLLVAAICLATSSCHSQKRVIHGDEGRTSDNRTHPPKTNDDKKKHEPRPKISDEADTEIAKALIKEAYSWLGTPYKWGGETKDGADCSGFVMMSYKNALGILLPRTSYDQGEFVSKIKKSELEVGDLLFFVTSGNGRVSHVGIYVGGGKFIHSSSSRGVVIDPIDNNYYVKHYHHSGKVRAYHEKVKQARNKKSKSK